MYKSSKNQRYIFIVDTESYAGNFEREMCAFCNGQIGDCGAGEKQAHQFNKDLLITEEHFIGDEDKTGPTGTVQAENSFDEKIERRADEHGCYRPVSMWETPGWFNNGMGGEFKEGQEDEALKNRNKEYKKEKSEEFDINEPLIKYPAYLSVAIFFSKMPTNEEIKLMVERAKKFAVERPDDKYDLDKPIIITGFRLMKETVSQTEVEFPVFLSEL